MTEAARACAWCGGSMQGKRSHAIYCAPNCQDAAWAFNNRDRLRELKKNYADRNREAERARSLNWARANPKKKKEAQRKWVSENRETMNRLNLKAARKHKARGHMQDALMAIDQITQLIEANGEVI